MIAIEAVDVARSYRVGQLRVEALRGVSLAVQRGTFVAITGPSGSGKSTLLYLLGGVEAPDSGRIELEGADLARMNDDQRTLLRRQRIGFVFQAFNLLPLLSAEENVALPLRLDHVPAATARRRALEALDLVEMTHRRTHVPGALSGGEQQRVAIARALAIQPTVLLADEPTGNLDSRQGAQIADLLRRLVDDQHHTLVLVTHEASLAAAADCVVQLRDGRIEQTVRQTPAQAIIPQSMPVK